MNKTKFFSSLLVGALVVSTGLLTSCKDYDDDISNLKKQIDSQASAIKTLQDAWAKGVVITSIAQDGKNVNVTTSDGSSYTVYGGQDGEDGADGKDADVWTIGTDGFWYKNSVKTEYKAVATDGAKGDKGDKGDTGAAGAAGADGKAGVYYEPNADGYFYLVDPNTTPATKTKTDVKWAEGSGSGVSAVKAARGVYFYGIEGVNGSLFIPTCAPLTSLVFVPQTYYWGIEAAKISKIDLQYYLNNGEKDGALVGNWKDLTTYIDDAAKREEIIGTKRPVSKENDVDYTVAGKQSDHELYQKSSKTVTVMLNAKAQYHWNPSIAYYDDDTKANVISANKEFTRGAGNATVSLLGASDKKNGAWTVSEVDFGGNQGKQMALTVPLKVEGKVGTITTTGATFDENPGVTTFATQITYNVGGKDTTVTSDYAAIIEETVKDLRLAHVKHNPLVSEVDDEDFIETKVFNIHCGECGLTTPVDYKKRGMHLFASIDEAKYWVTHSYRIDDPTVQGEGQDLVKYDTDINLNALVETHYTNLAGQHDVFNGDDFTNNFYYKFELTDFRIDEDVTKTNESAHAAIYVGEDGNYYLHPQDPQEGGLNGRPYDANKATEVVVNRVPLVRVSLIAKANDHVIDYGYLPIRIVKEKKIVVEKFISHTYTATSPAKVVRYNDCYSNGGDIKAFETNWRQTEEDLMSHPELANVMTIAEFRANYKAFYPSTVNELYQYRMKNEAAWLADNTVKPEFELLPVALPGTPSEKDLLLAQNVGKIAYRNATGTDLSTSTLEWTISPIEIQALAKNGIKNVVRAIKLVSQNAANYPDIYVIFKSGDIELEKKTVTANMHLTEKQIAEYWYNSGAFTQGTAEIHTNVITPEEAKSMPDTTIHTGTDVNTVWKPIEFKNTFANVFLKNFAGNTPADWITFDGIDTTDPNQPFKLGNLKFRIILDNDNIGKQFKGYLSAGAATTFVLKTTNFTDNTKDTLYARKATDPDLDIYYQKIAYITNVGTWSSLAELQTINIALIKDSDYAKAMLNYKDHALIGEDGVLNVKVAIVPVAQEGVDPEVIKDGLFKSVVKYTVSGVTYYCNLAIENYKFDVRFLRPVSLDKTKDTEIEDATSSTDKAQVIKLHDLINGYKDYRDAWKIGKFRQIGKNADGTPKYGQDNLDYEMYYAEDNEVNFTVGVQSGLSVGDYLSADPNVLTNLDASKRAADKEWVPLRDVSAIIDFKLTAADEITYLNNQATVQDFKVKMPVSITYYWGTIYDTVTISVKKTQSNSARR